MGLALPLIGAAGSVASCTTGSASPTAAAPHSGVVMPAPADIVARYSTTQAHAWGLDLPGIVRTVDLKPDTIALTFDACGGPYGSRVDDALINVLQEQHVPATLFWNKRWIDANPVRAREIAVNPLFQIENHGTSHKPLSVNGRSAYGIQGTANAAEVVEEIQANRRFLREFLGVESTWFRSGTAFYDDVAVRIAGDLGVRLAGFSVNGDSGATLAGPAVVQNLAQCTPGSIAILHMNQPGHGTSEGVKAVTPSFALPGSHS